MTAQTPLEPGQYYHVFNRGNNREDIFAETRNYGFFLRLYAHHVDAIADTFAYCLLRNHFHLLIRIKSEQDLLDLASPPDPHHLPSRRFANLFNAYARAFNQACDRTGALFQRPFRRVQVTSDAYFAQLVVYIHRNAQKHGFVRVFREWPHSSYHTLLTDQPTRLKRETVLEWFGGPAALAAAHDVDITDPEIADLAPEA
ncbi:MAG TPA: hypothetical protein PLJ35_11665 [Anaerolineae bacterium]|nr:hypothetical protein [Anaerolineae bacterium]HOQ99468.1 hypothetical protein [Anaerolineae bacterium]HPL30739.1 hypothetical protein [Anaerolineae bacterium]